MAHPKIYRLSAVTASTGLCSSSIYDYMSRNLFPKNFKLGGVGSRAVGWSADEVDAWVAERIGSRAEQTLTPTEQNELSVLLAQFPELRAASDTSGVTLDELRGLLRFLERRAQAE